MAGAVLETIMAKTDGVQGDRISAGGYSFCIVRRCSAMAYMRFIRMDSGQHRLCS